MATRAAAATARKKAAEVKAKSDANTEDTIVQVRNGSGEWTDYARTTRREALAALAAGRLPGKAEPEPLRAVDWITKEEVTAPEPRKPTEVEVKPRRSARSGGVRNRGGIQDAVEQLPRAKPTEKLMDGAAAPEAKRGARPGSAAPQADRRPTKGQKGVTSRKVAPAEPTRDGFRTDAQFAKAHAEYTAALAAFEATSPPVSPAPDDEEMKQLVMKDGAAKAASKPIQTKKARPPRVLGKQPSDLDGFNFADPKLPARVLRLKGQGRTIKQIAAELGLPAEERYWHRVSLVYRAAADKQGIGRPRRNGTK